MTRWIVSCHGCMRNQFGRCPEGVQIEYVGKPGLVVPTEMLEIVVQKNSLQALKDSGYPTQVSLPGDVFPNLHLNCNRPKDLIPLGLFDADEVGEQGGTLLRQRSMAPAPRERERMLFMQRFNRLPSLLDQKHGTKMDLWTLVTQLPPAEYTVVSCRPPCNADFPNSLTTCMEGPGLRAFASNPSYIPRIC